MGIPKQWIRRRWAALACAVLLLLGAGWLTIPAEVAAAPVWGRAFATSAQGDTIAVPVRWVASCDDAGCADSYRVTWGVEYMRAPGLDEAVSTDATANNVVREVVVTGLADTARVPAPAILSPATVCVYVVAIRRGLSSGVSSACRTIQAPDVAPPEVNDIRFDSMKIDTMLSLADSLDGTTLRIIYGLYTYGWSMDSITGARVADSALELRGEMLRRRRAAYIPVGRSLQLCGTVQHARTRATVILIPGALPYTRAQIADYQSRCGDAVQARASVARRNQSFYLTPEFGFSVSDAGQTVLSTGV